MNFIGIGLRESLLTGAGFRSAEGVGYTVMDIFQKAKGIFLPGKSAVPNVLAAFRLDFHYSGGHAEFTVAAHTFYRIYLNGIFLGLGPAPAAFGHLKADSYDLTGRLEEENQLAVEVMGYVPREFNYSTHETSVFFGELTVDGHVAAATGEEGWKCGTLPYRDFWAEALSHGRRYPVELYALQEGYADWRRGALPQETGFEVVAEGVEETWRDGGNREIPAGQRIVQRRATAMPDMEEIRGLALTGVSSVESAAFDGAAGNWWETDGYLARSGGERRY